MAGTPVIFYLVYQAPMTAVHGAAALPEGSTATAGTNGSAAATEAAAVNNASSATGEAEVSTAASELAAQALINAATNYIPVSVPRYTSGSPLALGVLLLDMYR